MRPAFLPSRRAIAIVAILAVAASAALLAQLPEILVAATAGAALLAALAWGALDLWRGTRAWRTSPLRIERRCPHAFALGVRHEVVLVIGNEGPVEWTLSVFDAVDPTFAFEGLPRILHLAPGQRAELRYHVVPRSRGTVRFGRTQLRLRTPGGMHELQREAGGADERKVFPNFAAVARYAWLASDRRLTQIGIKSYVRRGTGTDFKQLGEYRPGDPIRHLDWKATMRLNRPIVREFQDSRDQRVLFLLDCGRRMRADEGEGDRHGSHFDQALNALMLLAYVALKEGDEVGAMTFGTPAGEERHFAPRTGQETLNAITARLADIQPTTTHSDYRLAAQELMRRQGKRALVIVLTNFRDEDAAELQPALRLMRSRHLVLLASLRERVQRELAEQALDRAREAVVAAGAHLFEQSRRDAFRRMVGNDPLAIDVEPAQLAVSLVNHYHAVKRARLL